MLFCSPTLIIKWKKKRTSQYCIANRDQYFITQFQIQNRKQFLHLRILVKKKRHNTTQELYIVRSHFLPLNKLLKKKHKTAKQIIYINIANKMEKRKSQYFIANRN